MRLHDVLKLAMLLGRSLAKLEKSNDVLGIDQNHLSWDSLLTGIPIAWQDVAVMAYSVGYVQNVEL